jgi:hypothetical protein
VTGRGAYVDRQAGRDALTSTQTEKAVTGRGGALTSAQAEKAVKGREGSGRQRRQWKADALTSTQTEKAMTGRGGAYVYTGREDKAVKGRAAYVYRQAGREGGYCYTCRGGGDGVGGTHTYADVC